MADLEITALKIKITLLKIIAGAIRNIVFDESMSDANKITTLKYIINDHAEFIEIKEV